MSNLPPSAMPSTVAWLGYGGLLPFIATAGAIWLDRVHAVEWRTALLGYGAVILSFVGALHWGIAMMSPQLPARWRNALWAWSVVPALLAWTALLLPAAPAGSVLIIGFAAQYWQDRRVAERSGAPAWYLPLRLQLTLVAIVSLSCGVAYR